MGNSHDVGDTSGMSALEIAIAGMRAQREWILSIPEGNRTPEMAEELEVIGETLRD